MRRRRPMDTPEMPIAPMIDCVFLMLVYFMTTSSLEKSEADLPCPFGQAGAAADPLAAVDEQRLSIDGEGRVLWNGSVFDLCGDPAAAGALRGRLEAFRGTCSEAGSDPSLQVVPERAAPHQSLVTLLDAANLAGIEAIHFP
ncbi:MAG: ExbD/TolR family protein [Oceanipulchritudo sp.]